MRNKIGFAITITIYILALAASAWAVDVGDPIFKQDLTGNMRLELISEKYDRKTIIETQNRLTFATATGGIGANIINGGTDIQKTDIRHYLVRLNYYPNEKVSVYLDGGVMSDKGIGSSARIIGAGGRILTFEADKFRISPFAAFHYVSTYSFALDDFDPSVGHIREHGDQRWSESALGITVSSALVPNDNVTVTPYAGLMMSAIRGKVDAKIDFLDSGGSETRHANFEEAHPVIGIAGVSFLIYNRISIRSEGRFIGESSISGAIGMAF